MPITKPLEDVMNGFKVIKDLGRAENEIRYAIVMCKVCGIEFETSTYHIRKIKSCGCLPPKSAKELPEMINGFKILKDFGYSNGSRRALVVCKVCQKEYEADPNKLRYRLHCGCVRKGSIACKYNKQYPRLAKIYKHMITRCYRLNSQDYYNYGARGITVFEEWKKDRNIFCEWALANGYKDDLSIDRIDSNKGYFPDNCRWADNETQSRNTRRNVLTMEVANKIREGKQTMTYAELAERYQVSKGTVAAVLSNRIWKTK